LHDADRLSHPRSTTTEEAAMTSIKVPRHTDDGHPPPVLDLRLLVLLALTGLIVWLAVVEPTAAAAIAFGLSVLYLLHKLTSPPGPPR
jgi:hypothetical protein